MQNRPFFTHAGRLGLAVLLVAACTACQSRSVLPNRINPQELEGIESLRLDVRMMSSEFNVDYQANQLNLTVPVAAVTAAQVSAATTDRETAAAAGIIGTFIGIQIARSAHQAKLQDAANNPVAGLKHRLEVNGFHQRVREMFRRELERRLAGRYALARTQSPRDAVLDIALDVSLSPDLSSMHLRAEAVVRESLQGVPAYAREIDYYDTPIGDPSVLDQAALAGRWTENDGALFWRRLEISANALASLVSNDMKRGIVHRAPGGNAIRYRNERGLFYERGYLVETADDRLLIRTLRGGLVSVPGQLTNQENTSRTATSINPPGEAASH